MKMICIISGGMDSTVLLHQLVKQPGRDFDVFALSINYGQRHVKEIECAAEQCKILGVPHKVIDASVLLSLLGGSSLTESSIEVPEGHYAAENMKATVVPNRNMILLSLAAGYGISLAKEGEVVAIAYGAHAGDHEIYPDCRKEFIEAMNVVFGLCDWKHVELYTPFITLSKTDLVNFGSLLSIDFSKTWTCYVGKEKACGRCGTCVERLEAFGKSFGPASHIPYEDPLEYEDREFWKTITK